LVCHGQQALVWRRNTATSGGFGYSANGYGVGALVQRISEVPDTEPAVQFYSGNLLDGKVIEKSSYKEVKGEVAPSLSDEGVLDVRHSYQGCQT